MSEIKTTNDELEKLQLDILEKLYSLKSSEALGFIQGIYLHICVCAEVDREMYNIMNHRGWDAISKDYEEFKSADM